MSFQENNEENTKNNQSEDKTKSESESFGADNDADRPEQESENSKEAHDLPASPETDAEKISALQTELANVNAKLVETHNKMLRIAADADNTRKRLEKEKADTRLYCIQEFARDLLPVTDAFEKALQVMQESDNNTTEQSAQLSSITEGVKLVSKIFQDVTKKHGIERLPGKGAPFNPQYHNSIAKVTDSSYTTDTVIEEFMPGYKIGDRILRTALVKIGSRD